MRVDVWSYYSVGRPPVKFHRIRRSFDAPMDNYSGSIAGLTSDLSLSENSHRASHSLFYPSQSRHSHLVHPPSPLRFWSCPMRLHGPKPSLLSASNPSRASGSCREPDPGSRHRWVRINPKRLQNITVFLFGLPSLFFLTVRF